MTLLKCAAAVFLVMSLILATNGQTKTVLETKQFAIGSSASELIGLIQAYENAGKKWLCTYQVKTASAEGPRLVSDPNRYVVTNSGSKSGNPQVVAPPTSLQGPAVPRLVVSNAFVFDVTASQGVQRQAATSTQYEYSGNLCPVNPDPKEIEDLIVSRTKSGFELRGTFLCTGSIPSKPDQVAEYTVLVFRRKLNSNIVNVGG